MNKPETITQRTNAEAFLDALVARDIRHVFANAGTDFAPVIEALARYRREGRPSPRFHTVPHENLAVAMAHGYFLATGLPAAVMVHVTVGTANAACGVMNASRDNVPLLLVAGRTPSTESGHAGSRSVGIHWGQDTFDQGGMIREYLKWDTELRAGQSIEELVERALDIAMSEPCGPVYLTMPREILGDRAAAAKSPARRRATGALPSSPSREAMNEVAQDIARARFPVIITARLGRIPGATDMLADLAERFAIAVAYPGEPGARDVNLPAGHPMCLGTNPVDVLDEADLILVVDCEVPWWPRQFSPRQEVRVVHVATDPLFSRIPVRGFPMDSAIAGSPAAALQMLAEMLPAHVGKGEELEARGRRIREVALARHRKRRSAAADLATMRPIHPAWVASCLNTVIDRDTVIINELGVVMDDLDLRTPRGYLTTSPAAGLGFGLGAALGTRLGRPRARVILVTGDGSYMFGNPVAAHFMARAAELPTLTIVMNNARWHAVYRSTAAMYPAGAATAGPDMPLVALEPAPDYEQVIRSCGGIGIRVDEPEELPGALDEALRAVEAGQPALLNVIVTAAY